MELLFKEEVYCIVGSAIKVHQALGAGFLEAVYHEALEIQLEEDAIPFVSHQLLEIRFGERLLKRKYEADFVCFN